MADLTEEERDKILLIARNNLRGGFPAVFEKVQKEFADRRIPIRRKDVKEIRDQLRGTTATKAVRRPKTFSNVYAREVMASVQMDIMDLTGSDDRRSDKKEAKRSKRKKRTGLDDRKKDRAMTRKEKSKMFGGMSYALLVIDIKSRALFARLMPTKSEDSILRALRSIWAQMKRDTPFGTPRYVAGDQDFESAGVTEFFEQNNATPFISSADETLKNSLVERVIRTLRISIRQREENEKNINNPSFGADFPDFFEDVIDTYNGSKHRTTKARPEKVAEGRDESRQFEPQERASDSTPFRQRRYSFQVGDYVRYRVKLGVFEKRSASTQYSSEIYEITELNEGNAQSYELRKADGRGAPLKRLFKGFELVKVPRPDNLPNGANYGRNPPRRGPAQVIPRAVRRREQLGGRQYDSDED